MSAVFDDITTYFNYEGAVRLSKIDVLMGKMALSNGVHRHRPLLFYFRRGSGSCGVEFVFDRNILLPEDIGAPCEIQITQSEWEKFLSRNPKNVTILVSSPISLFNVKEIIVDLHGMNEDEDNKLTQDQVYKDFPEKYHKFIRFT